MRLNALSALQRRTKIQMCRRVVIVVRLARRLVVGCVKLSEVAFSGNKCIINQGNDKLVFNQIV